MAHLLFILMIFAFAIISKAMSASRRQPPYSPPRPTRPRPPAAPDTEEERMRQFMEAVGLPRGGAGGRPPIARPRPQAAPRPLMPVQPPPVIAAPGRLRRVQPQATIRPTPVQPQPAQPPPIIQSAEPEPVPALPTLTVPKVRRFAPLEPLEETPVAPKRAAYTSRSLLQDLRNPQTLREAIILREVLGPPKAIQIL